MAGSGIPFSEDDLRAATDSRSWKRGVDYHARGLVYSLLDDGETIVAKVRGTRNYKVRLWMEDGEIDGECSCPMGDAGVFCKHCVAVGLTHLEGRTDGGTQRRTASRKPSAPAVTLDDLREHLKKQDTSRLVEIIMRQAMEDDDLRSSLLLEVGLHGRGGFNVGAFREAIDQATGAGEFVDYRSAFAFTRRIEQVVDRLAQVLEEGHAPEAVELAERALARCEEALGMMDDSDGGMGAIMERLGEIHHAACAAARPDPEELARRLFAWELRTAWDTFYGAAEAYADVLGEKGLAVYRKLAGEMWDKVPQLGPGQREQRYEGDRHRLTSIMESLARADGDVEALVAVKSRDLSTSYAYLKIAEIYKQAKQSDKALKWAEDGLRAFPERTDDRLREFLADAYHRRRRHDEAMEIIWPGFEDRACLENYKRLKGHADRAKQWPKWRKRALETVHKGIGEARKEARRGERTWLFDTDHSLLVEIYLWEKDVESAWAEAKVGGCSNDLWMRLAELREKDHPADALGVYQGQVEPMVRQTNNQAYREATALIRRIGELMERLDRREEFGEYVASIRAAHKRKRNFIKLLDRVSKHTRRPEARK